VSAGIWLHTKPVMKSVAKDYTIALEWWENHTFHKLAKIPNHYT